MLFLYISIFVVVTLGVTYVFLVMPRSADAADMDLQSTDYAHRGLHSSRVPENSLAAFALAKAEGYGIELDVRLTADGKIVVFHDEELSRMCGIRKRISEVKYSELQHLRLAGSNETIPLLSEVLSLVDGHVPILIEIKHSEDQFRLCKRLAELMDSYPGAFAIQSFDPYALEFFKKYRPRFARGQLVARLTAKSKDAPKSFFIRFALSHMLTNVISRPDFISIEGNYIREPAFLLATRVFRSKGFVWTVRKQSQYSICRKNSLYAIFENIRPQ